jgi:hypothetical protein
MRKSSFDLCVIVACGFVALGLVVLLARAAPQPEPLPFDARYLSRMKKQRPDVVLIGNSMVYTRFDQDLLNELVSPSRALVISVGGAKSAVWYAQLKYSVVASGVQPRRVVVFFRGRELTQRPTADGPEADRLERATRGRDRVIERKLAVRTKNPTEGLRGALSRLAPVEDLRAHSWERVDELAMQLSTTLVEGPSGAPRKKVINRLFGVESLRPDPDRSVAVEEKEEKPTRFARTVARSFLPEILELAHENGIALTFVQVKTRRHAEGLADAPERATYQAALREYLERKGATYVDLTTNEWETLDLYASGDHIAPRHRPTYTRRFVRDHPEIFREQP